MPGEVIGKISDVVSDNATETFLASDEHPLLSPIARFALKKAFNGLLSALLGTAPLDVAARACRVAAVLFCPDPARHEAVATCAMDFFKDELKGEALDKFATWSRTALKVGTDELREFLTNATVDHGDTHSSTQAVAEWDQPAKPSSP